MTGSGNRETFTASIGQTKSTEWIHPYSRPILLKEIFPPEQLQRETGSRVDSYLITTMIYRFTVAYLPYTQNILH